MALAYTIMVYEYYDVTLTYPVKMYEYYDVTLAYPIMVCKLTLAYPIMTCDMAVTYPIMLLVGYFRVDAIPHLAFINGDKTLQTTLTGYLPKKVRAPSSCPGMSVACGSRCEVFHFLCAMSAVEPTSAICGIDGLVSRSGANRAGGSGDGEAAPRLLRAQAAPVLRPRSCVLPRDLHSCVSRDAASKVPCPRLTWSVCGDRHVRAGPQNDQDDSGEPRVT
eukprot:1491257-Rhodomonas_salina.4